MEIALGCMTLRFAEDFKELEVYGRTYGAAVRRVGDLRGVLLDDVDEGSLLEPAYFMFRGVSRPFDEQLFLMFCVRYDVTVIPPRTLGREPAKTMGHYHPPACGSLSYPEVYEVLWGEAHFLLQLEEEGCVKDLVLVKAKEGDKALIPPNYGHVTVNPSSTPLIMANLVASNFTPSYWKYQVRRGAAVYELVDGSFLPNANYQCAASLREEKPVKSIPGSVAGDLYTSFIRNPSSYRFLNNPKLTPKAW